MIQQLETMYCSTNAIRVKEIEHEISALLQQASSSQWKQDCSVVAMFFFAPQDQISCGALQPQSVNYQFLQRKLRPNHHPYRTFAALLQSQLRSPVTLLHVWSWKRKILISGLPSSKSIQAKASHITRSSNLSGAGLTVKSDTGLLSFSCFYCRPVVLPVVPNPIGLKTGYSNWDQV